MILCILFQKSQISFYNAHIDFCCFWVEIYPKFEDENVSEIFSAEIKLSKIDPCS
jgi:hypothetical protein